LIKEKTPDLQEIIKGEDLEKAGCDCGLQKELDSANRHIRRLKKALCRMETRWDEELHKRSDVIGAAVKDIRQSISQIRFLRRLTENLTSGLVAG